MLVDTSRGPLWVERSRPSTLPPQVLLWPGLFFDGGQHRPMARRLDTPAALIDPPGYGRSPAWKDLTLEACGQALLEIAEVLHMTEPVLGGTSWGGISAVHAALQAPDKVAGLILMNTPLGPGDPGFAGFVPELALLPPALFALGATGALFGATPLRHRKTELRRTLVNGLTGTRPTDRRRIAQAVLRRRPDLAPRLAAVRARTLLLCGDEDRMYPLASMRAHHAQFPDASLEVIADSGHSSALEHPAVVAAHVQTFLSSLDLP